MREKPAHGFACRARAGGHLCVCPGVARGVHSTLVF